MMMKTQFARWFRENQHWLSTAEKILNQFENARDGGIASKVMAAAAITNIILEQAVPENCVTEILRRRGYQYSSNPIGGFISELLANEPVALEIPIYEMEKLRFWEGDGGGVAIFYNSDGEYGDGPYLLGGDDAYLQKLLYSIVWATDTDLVLTMDASQRGSWKGSKKFQLDPMVAPGPYIGTKGPDAYAERIIRYGPESRTILLEGPTGCGKSVLARHIASLVAGESARTIKLAGDFLSIGSPNEILAIVKYFQPTVFLIDDITFDYCADDAMLSLFENLRADNCLIVLTSMIENPPKKRTRGRGYTEGMRPGRLDEVYTIYAPDVSNRRLILEYYYDEFGLEHPKASLHKKLASKTKGLTGAYLREFVRRLQVHGVENWEEELTSLLYVSPRLPRPSRKSRKETGSEKDREKVQGDMARNPNSTLDNLAVNAEKEEG